jgi:hypothetical protein
LAQTSSLNRILANIGELLFLRKKDRHARRYGMKKEPAVLFYPKYWLETAWKWARWVKLYMKFGLIYKNVDKDPQKDSYIDFATTPVTAEEGERELFQSDAAKAYVAQEKKLSDIRKNAVEA